MFAHSMAIMTASSKTLLSLCVVVLFICLADCEKDPATKAKKDERSATKLPPCAACTALVASFEAGMEKTSRGKLGGGDTAWEEKNQGSGYGQSEVRLVEIQETLCKDVERGELQCHDNHHNWEDQLEEWWKMDMETRGELKQWLCVDELKVCCPKDHYGPDCKPCSIKSEDGKICSGNGKCKGEGTRKGNGKCSCDYQYTGK